MALTLVSSPFFYCCAGGDGTVFRTKLAFFSTIEAVVAVITFAILASVYSRSVHWSFPTTHRFTITTKTFAYYATVSIALTLFFHLLRKYKDNECCCS